jgi:hypothetical protein
MTFVESPLCRLQLSFSGLIEPSAALQDVRVIQAQIELRRQALTEIELIRRRLRFFLGRKKKLPSQRLQKRRLCRSGLLRSYRPRVPAGLPSSRLASIL